MTDVLAPAAEAAPALAQAPSFDRKAALRSIGISIVVNAVLPFATYKILAPYFPPNSILPLLYASAFPLIGLVISLVRTRTVDAIAMFALFGMAYSITTTVLAGEVHLALIIGSSQGFVIAALFFVSALVGRPLLYYISRQFNAGSDPAGQEHFALLNEADGGRTFYIGTMVWAAGTLALSISSLVLALILEPAPYLLVNNIINIAANIVLVAWTIRFSSTRLAKVGERLAAEAAAKSSQ